MTRSKMLGVAMLAMGALVLCSMPLFAAQNSPLMPSQPQPILHHPVAFGAGHITTGEAPTSFNLHLIDAPRRIAKPHVAPVMDSVLQRTGPQSNEFNMVYQVMGVGNGFPGYSVPDAPPDTTMAVGDTEIVQWVNVSYADFNKSTGAIIPINGQDSTIGNYIWQTLLPGSACANNNDGDIIVKFDRAAHRWIMAQNVFNGPPYYVCVAISQTATFSNNSWYAYEYPVVNNGFPDYPKWGVWSTGGQSDGYYQNWNNFGPGGSGFVGPVMCGYDRAKMLTGNADAEQICFQLSNNAPNYQDSLLPGDRDSPTPPPVSQDEFFVGSWGDIDNAHLSAYSMHIVDWATGQATMTGNGDTQLIAIAPYTPACNGGYGGDCVPEPGGNFVDSLGDRLMYRFAYWDDTVLANATATPPVPAHVQHWYVDVDVTNSSTGANAVRWMEFDAPTHAVPATALTVFQQGTFAGNPGDSLWRWMGSLTRDNVDDVLVGYSVSSTSVYPSIAVAGRVVTDPVGTLSPEQYSVNGTGSQVDTDDRWGDYSTMAIDPTDNCTFFYTTEYYMITGSFDWSTNISSWKFPNCQ